MKELEKLKTDLKKKHGEGVMFTLEGDNSFPLIPVIPTGSFLLDVALGVGGLPRGRITEIYGLEGSGKTTLCQSIIKQAQDLGGMAAFIDVEHALDQNWIVSNGVDLSKLHVVQPDTGEQALDITEAIIKSKAVDVIVIDSVAALVPRSEIEGEIGDSHIGLQARLMSQALRRFSGIIKESNCIVIFTNQLREKIGFQSWGETTTTTGGMALRFYASVRISLKRTTQVKDGTDIVGNVIKADVRKNKVAPPFKSAEFVIRYDSGIDFIKEIIDIGSELNLIEKGGAGWFTLNGNKVQGQENLRKLILSDHSQLLFLENAVRKHLCLPITEE